MKEKKYETENDDIPRKREKMENPTLLYRKLKKEEKMGKVGFGAKSLYEWLKKQKNIWRKSLKFQQKKITKCKKKCKNRVPFISKSCYTINI